MEGGSLSMAAAAAAQVEGGTPGCARGGERHCPRPLPLAQGAGGTRDWCVISLPGCGIHRLCIKARALHPERKGKKKKKKEGRRKSPPRSSLVPIWLLAACLPLVSATAIPVCSDPAHRARSLEDSRALLAGRRGRAAAAAEAALPC